MASYTILLHPIQADFISSNALKRGYVGGRGSGKTVVGSYDMLTRACSRRNRLYAIVAPTYASLEQAAWRSFVDLADQMGKIVAYNRSKLRITLDSGSVVIGKSAENPERLRGPSMSGVWIDEAQDVHQAAYSILMATLREGGEMGWMTSTFTPKGKRHWTYSVFGTSHERRDPNTKMFKSRTQDNPFLPPEFESVIREANTSSMQKQEVEAEFLDAGGKVFHREWFADQFVETAPRLASRVRYWDKAATKDGGCFTAGVLIAATYDKRFFVEHVEHGQWSTYQRDEIIKLTAHLDSLKYGFGAVRIFVEQEPGSAGVDAVYSTIRQLAGNIVYADKVTGSKLVRAEPFAAQCERKNVWLVTETDRSKPWIQEYLDELCSFPEGDVCDLVDASSGAFSQVNKGVSGGGVVGGTAGGHGGVPAAPPLAQPLGQPLPHRGITSPPLSYPATGPAGRGGLRDFRAI